LENITGKKQHTTPPVLSLRSLNDVSITCNHARQLNFISSWGVSPEKLFAFTSPNNNDHDDDDDDDNDDDVDDVDDDNEDNKADNDDDDDDDDDDGNNREDGDEGIFFEDADEDQEKNSQVIHDKYDIDQSHDWKEDNTFPSSVDDVVHLELATICKDGNFPLKTYDEILRWAQRANLRGYRFPVHAPSYETFLRKLADRLEMDDFNAELV
jgi:hypothetical protein